jgi:nucleoside-diphosphate-sugar epimerase
MFKKIFITGGAGYVGSRLVPYLLKLGYQITVYDIMFFTDKFLPQKNKNLKIVKGDIRDIKKLKEASYNHDCFIHLACISNDASFVLNERLSTTINLECFEDIVKASKDNGIKRFIFASTSSVYGVSKKKDVTEEHALVPLTLYNKYKAMCEPILFSHTDNNFVGVIFRPATVCGYAPRLRLDLSVNILTNNAINKKKISVFGGDQLRPNLHILDYCEVVFKLINSDQEIISNKIYNVGNENLSIMEIAQIVKNIVQNFFNYKDIEILKEISDDKRSYHINSDKIFKELKFRAKRTVKDAVEDLCKAFKNGLIKNSFDDDIYFNVKRLKRLDVK